MQNQIKLLEDRIVALEKQQPKPIDDQRLLKTIFELLEQRGVCLNPLE